MHSYLEILQTVGVDKPADMLFITDDFQEAVAARAAGNLLLEFENSNAYPRSDFGAHFSSLKGFYYFFLLE